AEIANKILNNTLIKYREGLASSLELTQTQNQYLDALRQYVNAAQQALDSRAAMERVLGKYNLN
ncbi:MAG: TolC family protein, partial [Bacteroidota bacterium]|nr:TolC family protein [Bacteroidota bacterium]MDX5429149.1 TolC family protein [Bacteroidota bacterium]MDX5505870.1 TolC family protein [Bacteroidota bacterium]